MGPDAQFVNLRCSIRQGYTQKGEEQRKDEALRLVRGDRLHGETV